MEGGENDAQLLCMSSTCKARICREANSVSFQHVLAANWVLIGVKAPHMAYILIYVLYCKWKKKKRGLAEYLSYLSGAVVLPCVVL